MIAVLLETIHEEALTLLSKKGIKVVKAFQDAQLSEINKSEIDIIITRGKGQVRQSLIDECPRLKIIARCGVGLENIDVDYAKSKNIKVMNAPGSNTQTTAEHTIALMMMLVRQIYQPVHKTKEFDYTYRNYYSGDELHGKTLGIIGLGNIGLKVATMAKVLGLDVCYYSRNMRNDNFNFKEFDDLISTSDIISIHLPLNKETTELINEDFILKMKSGSYIVNTSRTENVDLNALLKFLDNGHIRGYASDCPIRIDNELWRKIVSHPNVIISPHIASLTTTTFYNMCMITISKVIEGLES